MRWAAVLLMAGSSERFGDEIPKQYQLLFGKPLFLFPLQTLMSFAEFTKIYLVIQKPYESKVLNWIASLQDERLEICYGGDTRQESSFRAVQKAHDAGMEYVLIHDAARPFVSKKIIEENLLKTPFFEAVDTCCKATDTLVKSKSGELIDSIPIRSHMYQGQTPQSFATPLILKAHQIAKSKKLPLASDDCSLILELKHPVGIVEGESSNFKITTPQDLLLAERLLPYLPDLRKQQLQSLQNKKYILCGATGDLGKAIDSLLKQEGAEVIGLSRSASNSLDLSDPIRTKKHFDAIFHHFGKVDGLILATGTLHAKPFHDLSLEEIDQLIRANLLSYLYPIQFASLKKGAHILAFSSSSYLKGRGGIALYAALKASIANFIQGLAEELPEHCINAIAPCRCKGKMRKEAFPEEDEKYLLDPIDVGSKAIEILKSSYTGLVVDVRRETLLPKQQPKPAKKIPEQEPACQASACQVAVTAETILK